MHYDNLKEIATYITENFLYDLMYDNFDVPNLSFDFKEKEAREFMNNIINETIERNFNKKCKIYDGINNVDYNNPVIEINDYKTFFLSFDKLTRSIYDVCNNKFIVVNDGKNSVFGDSKIDVLSIKLLIKYLWLRMTPDDFKNPELFLNKCIKMVDNTLFDEYYTNEGKMFSINDNCQVCYRNKLASSFDEEFKELFIYLKAKNKRRDYLPVIRYGIYKKDDKDICEIGSIQCRHHQDNDNYNIIKNMRKIINKDVPDELKDNVEPKKIISLLLFIKLLIENNIYEISIPSMYVLDYDFHEIWYQNDFDVFLSKWTDSRKELYPEEYEEGLEFHKEQLKKIDKISDNKTTSFIRLFERLMYHIPEIEIVEYPNELSNYMRLHIPKENSIDEVVKKLKKSL